VVRSARRRLLPSRVWFQQKHSDRQGVTQAGLCFCGHKHLVHMPRHQSLSQNRQTSSTLFSSKQNMSKQPNTLSVRHKYLKINIGLDPQTTAMLREMQHQLVASGLKKPSGSLMIRHALRQLHTHFGSQSLSFHADHLKALA
jgi:hypothetical protein